MHIVSGLEAKTAEELFIKYGHPGTPLADRSRLFNMLYILKHNPSWDNVSWECHSDKSDAVVWQQFWDNLEFFVDNMDEMNWDGRLNDYNHCPLYPFLVTLIGDTFPVGSIGGLLNDVLHQPKYADEVFKLLLLVDHLGQYRWVGGLACGVRSDTRILKECGPEIKQYKKAETALLDGGFPGRAHGVIPYPKPKKATLRKWCAQYNDGHSFIRGRGEHPFTQLYTWGVCREVF